MRNYDLEFLKRFSMVLGFLTIVTLGLMVGAWYLHNSLPTDVPPNVAKRTEARIAPVGAGLGQQLDFGGLFHLPLPSVGRHRAGQQADAGRQPFFHQRPRQPLGGVGVRAGGQDEEDRHGPAIIADRPARPGGEKICRPPLESGVDPPNIGRHPALPGFCVRDVGSPSRRVLTSPPLS